jgi:hypothetical protein
VLVQGSLDLACTHPTLAATQLKHGALQTSTERGHTATHVCQYSARKHTRVRGRIGGSGRATHTRFSASFLDTVTPSALFVISNVLVTAPPCLSALFDSAAVLASTYVLLWLFFTAERK